MAWWDNIGFYKRVTVIAVAITSVLAAAVAIANALQAGEPHWIATRAFVREQVTQATGSITKSQNDLQRQQIETQLQVAQGRRESIVAKIGDRQLLLKQPGPPDYERLAREQIGDLQQQLKELDEQIRNMRMTLSAHR